MPDDRKNRACRAVSRRAFVATLAGAAVDIVAGTPARAAAGQRIVALDAPSTEMLIALGIEPVGAAGLAGYRATEGNLPQLRRTTDIGFYYEPNVELLQALSPDFFVSSFGIGVSKDLLSRIAPVISVPIYGSGSPPYDAAIRALRQTAKATNNTGRADAFLENHDDRLAALRAKASGANTRPVYIASPLLDGRHVILYGVNSLFDEILRRIGLRNAYTGPTSPWGIASVGIETLASGGDAAFVYIESPVTRTALRALAASAIWQRLSFMREERVVPIRYLEMYGALPTADRFAEAVGGLLEKRVLNDG